MPAAAVSAAPARPDPSPAAAPWDDRVVDGIIRHGLQTVHRDADDRRAAEALAALFRSDGGRAMTADDRHMLHALAVSLRICLDPAADARHWTRVTTIIHRLMAGLERGASPGRWGEPES